MTPPLSPIPHAALITVTGWPTPLRDGTRIHSLQAGGTLALEQTFPLPVRPLQRHQSTVLITGSVLSTLTEASAPLLLGWN